MENLDKLAICAALGGGLLETMGHEGFGGVGLALGLMRLFAVFGNSEMPDISEKEVRP